MKKATPEEYFGKELLKVFKAIDDGVFGYTNELKSLIDSIRHQNDFYLVGYDFASFVEAQEKVTLFISYNYAIIYVFCRLMSCTKILVNGIENQSLLRQAVINFPVIEPSVNMLRKFGNKMMHLIKFNNHFSFT